MQSIMYTNATSPLAEEILLKCNAKSECQVENEDMDCVALLYSCENSEFPSLLYNTLQWLQWYYHDKDSPVWQGMPSDM